MDLITTAIVAAIGKLAEPAVKDAYLGLKSVLKRMFGSAVDLTGALNELEQDPTSSDRQKALANELTIVNASENEDVTNAVKRLAQLVLVKAAPTPVVRQDVSGDKNIFSGTGNITINNPKS